MKSKLISVFLISLILILVQSINVQAAETDGLIITTGVDSKEYIVPGEEFTVTYTGENSNGVSGLKGTFIYDSNVFEVVSSGVTNNVNWTDLESFPEIGVAQKNSTETYTRASLYQIKLKVKSVTQTQTTTINLQNAELVTKDNTYIEVEDATKTFTIKVDSADDDSKDEEEQQDKDKGTTPSGENGNNNGSNGTAGQASTTGSSSTQGTSATTSSTGTSTSTAKTTSTSSSDSNESNKEILNAGKTEIISIIIIAVSVFGVISYKKYKSAY